MALAFVMGVISATTLILLFSFAASIGYKRDDGKNEKDSNHLCNGRCESCPYAETIRQVNSIKDDDTK